MKKLFLSVFFFCSFCKLHGQGYDISVQITGLKDSTCTLGYYSAFTDGSFIPVEEARFNLDKSFYFRGKSLLPEGLYAVRIGKEKKFDVVLGSDQTMKFKTDLETIAKGNPPTKISVEGSKDNELYYSFNQKIQPLFDEQKNLNLNTTLTASQRENKRQEILQNVDRQKEQLVFQNYGTLTSKLFKWAGGRPETKKDFLLGLDLNDERLLRTPFLHAKLNRYFNTIIEPHADSINKATDQILLSVRTPSVRKYIINRIVTQLEQSNVPRADAAVAYLSRRYYVDEPDLWDPSTVTYRKAKISQIQGLQIGTQLPELKLTDTLGKNIDFQNIKAEYLVVFIYADDCSHCHESAKKVLDFYEKYKYIGAKVLAINGRRNEPTWIDFIRKHKFQPLINGTDIHVNPTTKAKIKKHNFSEEFDVVTTPTIYVLDKNKRIVLRKLTVEQLDPEVNTLWEAELQRRKQAKK